jgi:hypothetical protein
VAQLHLTKVAVGCRDLDALKARIDGRCVDGEVRVPTRMRPRRAEELVGGSLFWIVSHRLVARQRILRLEDREDGRIDIVCSGDLVAIVPRRRRAHQGWRYLEEREVPPQGDDLTGIAELPPQLYGKLAALALV